MRPVSEESAVHFFAGDHPRLPRMLREKLVAASSEKTLQLIGALDWVDFRERLGVIRGLQEAAKLCEGIEKLLNGD